jgi:hypothetical protein
MPVRAEVRPARQWERASHRVESAAIGLQSLFTRDTVRQSLMFAFCVLFSLALIVNTQGAGDGTWFWYAVLLRGGRHLYSDMHLPLQPLFVLETSWFLSLLGDGWVASKVAPALHAVAYCLGIFLVVRRSGLRDGGKAVVLGCVFFLSICSPLYRFDDFHVLADGFEAYAIWLLLLLKESRGVRSMALVAGLGLVGGLAFTDRLNDGGALILAVAIGILCLAPSRPLLAVLRFMVVAGMTVTLVVALTGDSLQAYAANCIFGAAGSKGGAGHVLRYPMLLPWNTMLWLQTRAWQRAIVYCAAIALAWGVLVEPLVRNRNARELAAAVSGVAIILFAIWKTRWMLIDSMAIVSLAAVGVFLIYGTGLLVLVRCVRWLLSSGGAYGWDRREILFLIPFGSMASMSTSSGGSHLGIYSPLALWIAIAAVVSPVHLKVKSMRPTLLALCALIFICGVVFKTRCPYSWHSYGSKRLFSGRQWFHHPVYGPMLIETAELKFIEPVCETIQRDGDGSDLLSLPFPFANYFCAIPPWHGYVQTFFDTSSKESIENLQRELETAPPKWIFYQRQMKNLTMHEGIYNQGRPLPQRYLDTQIMDEIRRGAWRVDYASDFGSQEQYDNRWMLIQTRP